MVTIHYNKQEIGTNINRVECRDEHHIYIIMPTSSTNINRVECRAIGT